MLVQEFYVMLRRCLLVILGSVLSCYARLNVYLICSGETNLICSGDFILICSGETKLICSIVISLICSVSISLICSAFMNLLCSGDFICYAWWTLFDMLGGPYLLCSDGFILICSAETNLICHFECFMICSTDCFLDMLGGPCMLFPVNPVWYAGLNHECYARWLYLKFCELPTLNASSCCKLS